MAVPNLAIRIRCPICEARVSPEDEECPRCGEVFAGVPHASPLLREPHAMGPARREKFLRYAGIVLAALGGPGVALGSWLHDVLRISFLNYDAFNVFGPMNELVLAVGLVMMFVGIVFILLSRRLASPLDTEDGS